MLLTLGFLSNYRALLTPNDLDNPSIVETILEANKENNFSHYMICAINRFRIRNESIINGEKNISFTIIEQVDEFNWEEITMSIPSLMSHQRIYMSVDGTTIRLQAENGHEELFMSVIVFLDFLNKHLEFNTKLGELSNLNIKYIGQTELSKKYIRFKDHKKISKILRDYNINSPHQEIKILLLSFQPPLIQALLHPDIDSQIRNDWMPNGDLFKELPKKDWKTIVEATMIHHYKPKLNVHYKDNFPSDKHIGYAYFYDKRIRSIFVELHGEYSAHKIGNENIKYTYSTIIEYALEKINDDIFIYDNNNQDLDKFMKLLSTD